MKTPDYHSALWDEAEADPTEQIEFPAGRAFRHDIRNGLTEQFRECDVFYSEPPWPSGFRKFNNRAGSTEGNYRGLMESIGCVIGQLRVPVFLMVCRLQLRHLPIPLQTLPIGLSVHGGKALLACFGARLDEVTTTDDLLVSLAAKYNCVGDFCCGYGRTGRIFQQQGRRFVLSDYNARCIGHIAAHQAAWSGSLTGQDGAK